MTRSKETPADAPRERNRPETAARILAAVGEVLARDGFGGLGVNAVARHAGVDKVLIYRYFGGMPELLKTWGESGRFWPGVDEILGADPQAFMRLPLAERYARFFAHFIDGLRARPLTLEIMAAELVERNELTAILETEREEWGEQAGRLLGGDEWSSRPALRGITLLLVGGVQYLLVRSRKIRVFGGLDIRSDRDWEVLKGAVGELARSMLVTAAASPSAPAASTAPAPSAVPAASAARAAAAARAASAASAAQAAAAAPPVVGPPAAPATSRRKRAR